MSKYSLKEPVLGPNGYNYNLLKPTFDAKPSIGITNSGDIVDLSPDFIHFDATLFFPMTLRVSPVAIRVYMALLQRLVSNDIPVLYTGNQFREKISVYRRCKKVNDAIFELERERLILRYVRSLNEYYINPVYAWKGDRSSYIIPETLPEVNFTEETLSA